METHAPSHPLRSLKEFVVHILIVTIGILIALSLEGVREGVRERRLVREARENFRLDIEENRAHLAAERDNLRDTQQAIIAALAQPATAEGSAAPLPKPINPSFYFFRATSWDTALSTGALSHMNAGEVTRYADMHEAVRTYTEIGQQALEIFLKFEALQNQKSLSPDQRQRREELLRLLLQYEQIMQNVTKQFSEALEAAGKVVLK